MRIVLGVLGWLLVLVGASGIIVALFEHGNVFDLALGVGLCAAGFVVKRQPHSADEEIPSEYR